MYFLLTLDNIQVKLGYTLFQNYNKLKDCISNVGDANHTYLFTSAEPEVEGPGWGAHVRSRFFARRAANRNMVCVLYTLT